MARLQRLVSAGTDPSRQAVKRVWDWDAVSDVWCVEAGKAVEQNRLSSHFGLCAAEHGNVRTEFVQTYRKHIATIIDLTFLCCTQGMYLRVVKSNYLHPRGLAIDARPLQAGDHPPFFVVLTAGVAATASRRLQPLFCVASTSCSPVSLSSSLPLTMTSRNKRSEAIDHLINLHK